MNKFLVFAILMTPVVWNHPAASAELPPCLADVPAGQDAGIFDRFRRRPPRRPQQPPTPAPAPEADPEFRTEPYDPEKSPKFFEPRPGLPRLTAIMNIAQVVLPLVMAVSGGAAGAGGFSSGMSSVLEALKEMQKQKLEEDDE